MRRCPITLAITGAALVLVGCGTAIAPAAGAPLDGEWELASGTVDGRSLELRDDARVTLFVQGGEVSGTSACNGYSGAAAIEDTAFAVTGLGGTEMGCAEPIMRLEDDYLTALGAVRTAAADGDRLTLNGDGVVLEFHAVVPVDPAQLTGTVWVLESVGDATGPDSSVASTVGERAHLELRQDGSVVGSTGCRTFDGAYTLQGDTVQLHEMAMRDLKCPTDVRTQDDRVVSVIGDGFVTEITGERLTASDPDGSALEYRSDGPLSATPTVGTTWTLLEASVDARVLDAGNGDPVTLVYDGIRVTGSLGCNSYVAPAALDGSALVVGEIEVTAMSCPDNATRERTFLDALQGVETFDRVGDLLLLRGGDAHLRFGLGS